MSRIYKALGFTGGLMICALFIYLVFLQFDLTQVLSGELPLGIAISTGIAAMPFLLMLLILGIAAIFTALKITDNRLAAALVWLITAGILSYSIYLARFSAGLLLVLPTALILLAGLSAAISAILSLKAIR